MIFKLTVKNSSGALSRPWRNTLGWIYYSLFHGVLETMYKTWAHQGQMNIFTAEMYFLSYFLVWNVIFVSCEGNNDVHMENCERVLRNRTIFLIIHNQIHKELFSISLLHSLNEISIATLGTTSTKPKCLCRADKQTGSKWTSATALDGFAFSNHWRTSGSAFHVLLAWPLTPPAVG